MTKWAEKLHNLDAGEAKEFILGQSSTVEEVFLSHQHPLQDAAEYELDVCNNTVTKPPSSPKGATEVFEFKSDKEGPNCYQVCLSSVIIIGVICFLVVICRDLIRDLLIWLASVHIAVSIVIFLLLFIIVSYPMAWGVILLMIACGYLYGYICGPLVVLLCSACGIAIAQVTMKNFCRSFIIRKFYNEKMTAVINVVGGKHGFKVVALTRLTPIPFGLQNSLFSLTDIPLLKYVAASTVGLMPTAVLNCYMGTTLRRMEDVFTDEKNQATGWIVLIVQILFTIALSFFVVRKARQELKKTVETDEESALIDVSVTDDKENIFKEKTHMNGQNGYTGNNRTRIKTETV